MPFQVTIRSYTKKAFVVIVVCVFCLILYQQHYRSTSKDHSQHTPVAAKKLLLYDLVDDETADLNSQQSFVADPGDKVEVYKVDLEENVPEIREEPDVVISDRLQGSVAQERNVFTMEMNEKSKKQVEIDSALFNNVNIKTNKQASDAVEESKLIEVVLGPDALSEQNNPDKPQGKLSMNDNFLERRNITEPKLNLPVVREESPMVNKSDTYSVVNASAVLNSKIDSTLPLKPNISKKGIGLVKPKFYHLSSNEDGNKPKLGTDPGRDWLQAAYSFFNKSSCKLGIHPEALQVNQIEVSTRQCMKNSDCYKNCMRSMPYNISLALNITYGNHKSVRDGKKLAHVACTKLFITSPRITFNLVSNSSVEVSSTYMSPYLPKNRWAARMKKYTLRNNCNPVVFPTFDLTVPEECDQLLSFQNSSTLFFWKDPKNFGGEGMEVKTVHEKQKESEIMCPMTGKLIAQEYASPLWLINNRKFDNRVYLFFLSLKPLVVFMRPGYLQFSLFDFNRSSSNPAVHITNPHLQEPHTKIWSDFLKPYGYLLKSLIDKHDDSNGSSLFRDMVKLQVQTVLQFLFANIMTFKPTKGKRKGENAHALFGFDMIVTDERKWYILDVNRYPAWRVRPTHVDSENYRATLEAFTMLGEVNLQKEGIDWANLNLNPRHWVEIYNGARGNPSPFLKKGECAFKN